VLRQNGLSYLLWSGREDASDTRQHLYIAPLRTPWELGGPRVRIASPTHPWEGNVNEGPQVLRRNGRLFITFSANSCTSDDYALGLLTAAEGSDPLDPASWTKTPGPVFQKAVANGVYGPGHNGLTTSSDGTEDWLLYHANAGPGQGCGGLRITRAQKFSWHADGTPDFGTPACTCEALPLPAGERGASPLVANASFEAEGRADQTPRNWSTWVDEEVGVADAGADFVEAGGRSGSFAGVHRKGSDYQVATQQVVTALRNGTYTLRAWIQSSGGQEQARLYAAGYGGPGSWVDIPASAAWRQVAISGINVTAGRATIGFSSRSPGGRWLRFDDVELVKEPDLLQNASFQLDGPNTQEISGWKTWPGADGTGADADRVERGGHGGDYRAGHFKATDYQVGTYQTVTGLVNGRYTLSAWVRSSGGQEAAYLEVKDFGAPVRRVDIPGTNNWVQIVVRDIAVTNGQATVGFYSFSPGEKWLRFDDVEFYRQD
jgi:hypothetical protein